MIKKKVLRPNYSTLITVFFAGAAVVLFLSVKLKTSSFWIGSFYLDSMYYPRANGFASPVFGKVISNWYVYLIAVVSFVGMFFLNKLFEKFKKVSFMEVLFVTFFFVVWIQSFGLIKYFGGSYMVFNGKSVADRNLVFGKDSVLLAQVGKRNLKASQSVQFVTDMDISSDPGMLMHRRLAYYLYPIDMRNVRKGQKNGIVFFNKRSAVDHVPEGFQISGVLSSQSLFALKEEGVLDAK